MKTEHYPSLKLCMELDKILPKINNRIALYYEIDTQKEKTYINDIDNIIDISGLEYSNNYICPSIMEMLDLIPDTVEVTRFNGKGYIWEFQIEKINEEYCVQYTRNKTENCIYFLDSLPNALANIILWLKHNNLITNL